MDISKKKVTAEFCGFVWEDRLHIKYGPDAKYSGYYLDGREWNPWEKHSDFKEVWRKLGEGDEMEVFAKLNTKTASSATYKLLNNLSAFMDACYEIIAGEG